MQGRVAGKALDRGILVLSVVSPLDVDCAPREAGTEGGEDEVVALLELLLKLPDTKRNSR